MEIREKKDIEKFLPDVNIIRNILPAIINWLDEKEIIVLLGARQVGKTTIDFPKDKKLLDNDYIIKLAAKNKKKKIIFIDEVQRLENPGLFLKYIYDLSIPIKLIVSGSSALELKAKVSEALTGRKMIFNINPFNISEIKKHLMIASSNISDDKSNNYGNELSKIYTQYGGYPSIVVSTDNGKKILRLKEIFKSYMEKDIKKFLEIKNESAFARLITLLSASSGNLINMDEISNTLSIHKVTLDNYFYYLEQTFIIDRIRPFFKNIRKEIIKSPKVYFNDIGFRNFAINNFNELNIRGDKGFVFENFVYLVLKGKLSDSDKINFWRTRAGAEVDFIISKDLKPVPIEVKAKYLKKPKITRSMRSFIDIYKPEKGYVVNFDLDDEIKIGGCIIRFVSARRFAEDIDTIYH
jgi:predicted AAA+ superfamily ATPase